MPIAKEDSMEKVLKETMKRREQPPSVFRKSKEMPIYDTKNIDVLPQTESIKEINFFEENNSLPTPEEFDLFDIGVTYLGANTEFWEQGILEFGFAQTTVWSKIPLSLGKSIHPIIFPKKINPYTYLFEINKGNPLHICSNESFWAKLIFNTYKIKERIQGETIISLNGDRYVSI